VEAVDEATGTITLWLVGFMGLHTVRLADEMPDWMREAGAVFEGEISEESYRAQDLRGATWANIERQPFADLSEDEVLAEIDRLAREMGLAVGAA
jgi:hypothetical protein